MCAVAASVSFLAVSHFQTNKFSPKDEGRRRSDVFSSLFVAHLTCFHGSTSTPKGFLSFSRFTTDRRGRAKGGIRKGRREAPMEMGRRRRQVKRKSRREGGGGHYSDYVDCPAGRCRLPSKAPTAMSSARFRDFPLGSHLLYSSRCTGSSARPPPPPGTLRAPGRSRAGGVEMERGGLMAAPLALARLLGGRAGRPIRECQAGFDIRR